MRIGWSLVSLSSKQCIIGNVFWSAPCFHYPLFELAWKNRKKLVIICYPYDSSFLFVSRMDKEGLSQLPKNNKWVNRYNRIQTNVIDSHNARNWLLWVIKSDHNIEAKVGYRKLFVCFLFVFNAFKHANPHPFPFVPPFHDSDAEAGGNHLAPVPKFVEGSWPVTRTSRSHHWLCFVSC